MELKSLTQLPRALRALAHEPVVTEDGPHPPSQLEPSLLGGASSFLPAVPPTCHKQRSRAVSSGHSTVTPRRPFGRVQAPDLGWGGKPKLHGMQGVSWPREAWLPVRSRSTANRRPHWIRTGSDDLNTLVIYCS